MSNPQRAHPPAQLDPRRWGERERLWRRFVAAYPALDGYRERARRELPVVVLEPSA